MPDQKNPTSGSSADPQSGPASSRLAQKVGFVSLGCPKALVDSERILTQLRMEGYEIAPSYDDAEVVVVNTCGFIDSAKQESLEAIGEALQENGKVIVTGCMGADAKSITSIHPGVLHVSGPQAYEEVVSAVHEVIPPQVRHDPFTDLVPPPGDQADSSPLRLPENIRGLQSQLYVMHHSIDARQAGQPPGR